MSEVRIQTITVDEVRVKGVVYTGQQIIEQVNSWTCRITGLPIRFLRFEREWGRKVRRLVVAELPSGDEWKIRVEQWIGGNRPSVLSMDQHIIIREVEEFGYRFIKMFRNYNHDNYMRVESPTGEILELRVTGWREGKRPGGSVGAYCETFFDRKPEMLDAAGLLYYLKFSKPNSPPFFKVGITAKETVQQRFGGRDGDYTVTVLSEDDVGNLYNAFRLEQDLLREFAHHRVIPDPPLRGGGNTECFSCDLLGLDPESEDYHWLNEVTIH